jgi:HK97 family phage major capsid protein
LQAGETKDDGPGWKISRYVRAGIVAHDERISERAAAVSFAKVDRRYGEVVDAIDRFESARKAMAATDLTSGGALIATPMYSDYIDLLRPNVVCRKMGATVIPVPSGTLDMGRLDTGATAAYVGENAAPNASQPTTGNVKFNAKKLAIIVPLSNDLIRRSAPGAEAVIRGELLARAAVREDLAFIRGDGSANTPKGLRYWAAAANVFTSAVTDATTNFTAANIGIDFGKARRLLKDANTPMLKPGWVISPRTEEALRNLRDSVGGWLYRKDMDEFGKLDGFPYATTTQIPNNLGSNDESEIYLVDFAEFLIGDTMTLAMTVSDGAAYNDAAGNVVAAFSADQTVLKLIAEHDTAMRHTTSVAVITACHYGAA